MMHLLCTDIDQLLSDECRHMGSLVKIRCNEGQAEVWREADDSWGGSVNVEQQSNVTAGAKNPSKDLTWGSEAFQLDACTMCMCGRCI